MNVALKLGAGTLALAMSLIAPVTHAGTMEGGKMDGGMWGKLAGAGDHHAAGTVAVTKDAAGKPVLTLTDLAVDKVPDGRVYLAKDGDYTKGVELGKLTQFSGTVSYPIPASVNAADYNGVVIWCQKFSVEIGRAMFEGAMMKDEHMMDKDKGMMKK